MKWVKDNEVLLNCFKEGKEPKLEVHKTFLEDQKAARVLKISSVFPEVNLVEIDRAVVPAQNQADQNTSTAVEGQENAELIEDDDDIEDDHENDEEEETRNDPEYTSQVKIVSSSRSPLRSKRIPTADKETMTDVVSLPLLPLRDGKLVDKKCVATIANMSLRTSINRARENFVDAGHFYGQNYKLNA